LTNTIYGIHVDLTKIIIKSYKIGGDFACLGLSGLRLVGGSAGMLDSAGGNAGFGTWSIGGELKKPL
jgi:hypothetical protein